ncbi:MAG: rod shape-determining protein MreC [Clostridiales bacterium]|nr:rod shape-determining protein MreC [Clostridiales bacterium]
MKKLLKSKWFIALVVLLVLAACAILSLLPNSPVRKLLKPVQSVSSPAQSFVKNAGDTLSDFWAAITDGIAIREENEALKEEIADLRYQLTQNEEAALRYEELKDALHIKDTFSNYEIYGASILSRESDEWFSTIRLNAGSVDGIELAEGSSYPVLDVEMNLVGRVIETSDTESRVLPLLHEGFSVAGKVNTVNGATFMVLGDAELKRQGLCLVTDIDPDVKLEPGMEIVTSGDGGLFPEGIPIGVIESVDNSNPLQITATLRPYSQIGKLEDVFIMIPYVEEPDEESAVPTT